MYYFCSFYKLNPAEGAILYLALLIVVSLKFGHVKYNRRSVLYLFLLYSIPLYEIVTVYPLYRL